MPRSAETNLIDYYKKDSEIIYVHYNEKIMPGENDILYFILVVSFIIFCGMLIMNYQIFLDGEYQNEIHETQRRIELLTIAEYRNNLVIRNIYPIIEEEDDDDHRTLRNAPDESEKV